MNRPPKAKRKIKPTSKKTKQRKATRSKQQERAITRDQFHSLVRKAAQPTKKPRK